MFDHVISFCFLCAFLFVCDMVWASFMLKKLLRLVDTTFRFLLTVVHVLATYSST